MAYPSEELRSWVTWCSELSDEILASGTALQGNTFAIVESSMKVRYATPDDGSPIFSFIPKKSDHDREIGAFSGVPQVTEDKIRNTLFGVAPISSVLFAELSGQEVGFALYGYRYSSFFGQPSVWLDDLYVDAEMRGQGLGAELMVRLAHIAKENDCAHLAWNADARNSRGLSFYDRLGA
jgi:GNAT superfamily N-acetyltransferase